MKTRRNVTFAILLILFMIILFNYKEINQFLNTFLENQIIAFGYLAIAVAVFALEFFPQPFLSALVPFTTGLLLGMDFYYLLLTLGVFAITANYTAYWFGRHYGKPIIRFFINQKNYDRSLRWFNKYGYRSISFLALTPLPYFPVLGGLFRMTFKEFTIYAIFPRILHVLIFSYMILVIV